MRYKAFREKLRTELLERTRRNPKYSVRAFAKSLNIGSSSLSHIINGDRPLTEKMCYRLGAQLGLSPDELNFYIEQGASKVDGSFSSFEVINSEMFKVISDWHHYAILELTSLDHFQPDPKWVSSVLGININQVHDAVRRMTQLKILEITEDGKWLDRLGDANNSGNQTTSEAFRSLQKQVLEKAIDALETVPYEERVQTSMTLPVAKDRISGAKKRILRFVEELDDYLKSGKSKDEVYNMTFSLYPLSNTSRN